MTLALACITPYYVTIVADRRSVYKSAIHDEFETKMVQICDRGVVTFSGLARIPVPGKSVQKCPKMDEWIVSQLARRKASSLSEAAKILRTEATSLFRKMPISFVHKRHAFLLAGWGLMKNGLQQPVLCSVSNALDDDWKWLPSAKREFEQRHFILDDPKKFAIESVGVPIPKNIVNDYRRFLRRGFSKNITPKSVLRLSVATVRRVAEYERLVGKHLLGVCIPPFNLQADQHVILASEPVPNAVTFFDYEDPQDYGEWMGPHYVCNGVRTVDFKVGWYSQ
jgi:hypothetical protein